MAGDALKAGGQTPTTWEMAARLTPPVRVLLLGAVPGIALVGLFRTGAIGGAAFQAGLTVLFLLGAVLVLSRGVLRSSSRRGWLALGLALVAGMTGNALTGWDVLGLAVPEIVGIALGASAFLLSVAGLAFMLADRPSRLPLGAALDGMTGALVAQAVIAAILFSPVKGALQDGFDVVVLLYPLADVLLMGLVAAAVAHGGWRLDFWAVSLAGLVAITIGDSSALATSIVGDHVQGGAADLGWLAGTWLLAVAAWSPEPKRTPDLWVRSAVPVVLGTVALGIVVITAFSPNPLIPTLACASGALAVVVGRLAITLHDNNLMLSVARTDSVTDALTGLGNRRQLIGRPRGRARPAPPRRAGCCSRSSTSTASRTTTTRSATLPATRSSRGSAPTSPSPSSRRRARTGWAATSSACSCTPARATTTRSPSAQPKRSRRRARVHGDRRPRRRRCSPARPPTASDALRRADDRMYEDKSGSRVGSRRQVTQALMLAIEERDRALHGHGEGVQELASCVARRLGLSATDADAVRLGALLHDVGKLAIPDRILEKPGPLDPTSGSSCAATRSIGQRILEGAPALRDVAAARARRATSTSTAAATPTACAARTSRPAPASSPSATPSTP